uniref:Ig-like domain-containing protein n=1 Tax=Stomoxys calcitrans TaxID=35570 RepID=A0A1I8PKZ4_STOCA
MKLCPRIWKKTIENGDTCNNLNKTLPHFVKGQKPPRRRRKRRRCGNRHNSAADNNNIYVAKVSMATLTRTTATSSDCVARTTLRPCKSNTNCKRKQTIQGTFVKTMNKDKIKEICSNDNSTTTSNKNDNKCCAISRGEGIARCGKAGISRGNMANMTSSLLPRAQAAFVITSMAQHALPRAGTCIAGNGNCESVQLNLKQNKQYQLHQHRRGPKTQWAGEQMLVANKQCDKHNNPTAAESATDRLSGELTTATGTATCAPNTKPLSAIMEKRRISALPPTPGVPWQDHCQDSPQSPLTFSSYWSHKKRLQFHSSAAAVVVAAAKPPITATTTTAASFVYPTPRNKLFLGMLITLLVLNVCHNNVPMASAASVTLSKGSIPSFPEQRIILSSPAATTTTIRTLTTRPATSETSSSSSSFVTRQDQLQDQANLPQQSQRLPISANPLLLIPQNKTQPTLVEEDKSMAAPIEVLVNPRAMGHALMAAKQKRQQRGGHQLPQYLTSTQGTSFGQNATSLEATHRNSFKGTSLVGGRLTVPMDDSQMVHQQQPQQNYNRSNGGMSLGGSPTDDFNELVPFPKKSSMPVFDYGMPQNITARTGHMEAVLKCRVDRIGDKSVSWIRKRDLHILTVGKTTYTSDNRFLVTESKDSREWTLHVKSPQARDSGIYECQVNTEPKMSMAFQLNVIEISPDAQTIITGPSDLYVKVGSVITLTCLVSQPSIKDIGPIHWYRSEHLLTPLALNDDKAQRNYFVTPAALTSKTASSFDHASDDTDMYDNNVDDDEHMSQNVKDEITLDFRQRVAMEQKLCDTIKSKLRISNAQISDSGNYTCQPTTSSSASVTVHVINDENPAAMQKGGTDSGRNL